MNEVQTRSSLPAETQLEQYDYVLLDGSGSMLSKWWDMLDAIDAYVGQLKTMGTKSHIHLSIFTDGDDLDMIARDQPIAAYVPLSQNPVGSTWGGTPLYDAINVMCRNLRNLDPKRASLVIVTDGGENGSKFTDQIQARAMLDWARAKGWSVTFIGCDFNNSNAAAALGASKSEAIGVQKKLLAEAARDLARKRHAYGVTGAPVHWSEEEQRQFGGYLAGPASE